MSLLRDANVRRLANTTFDVLVVGGGINGAASAASLSARGLKVALIDRGDFASGTSQQSSNLIWGGFKYLESLEFGLVRTLCKSRNELIRRFPSAVSEIRFLVVHDRSSRHRLWKLAVAAWVYWILGGLVTARPSRLTLPALGRMERTICLDSSDGAIEYSDAHLHDGDAHFVFGIVRSAMASGCVAANYVERLDAKRDNNGLWVTTASDVVSSRELKIKASIMVNAGGPFVDEMNGQIGLRTAHRHVFSKGIHLVVDRITDSHRVLAFFADDGRLFFVIPMGPRSCIGTTDTPVDRPVAMVTQEDREFVLRNINERLCLDAPLVMSDVIAERCGVRPLAVRNDSPLDAQWSRISRKHIIEVDPTNRYISIFGGKLTDCINVGEEIAQHVRALGIETSLGNVKWYGEPAAGAHKEYLQKAKGIGLEALTSAESSESLTARLWRRCGADALHMLDEIQTDPRMAEAVISGNEYTRCEVAHAARYEMIVTLEDFLRRRSDVAQTVRRNELLHAPGVREICSLLFGDKAQDRFDEYFGL